MSIENKKISDDELDNVTGGCSENKYFPGNKSDYNSYNIPVDKYCGVIGEKYLFVNHHYSSDWIFGELRNTYEKNGGAFTERVHDIYVLDGRSFCKADDDESHYLKVDEDYGTREISGDNYQMYAKAGE